MGAALAGVFWGVLDGLLAEGTSMVAAMVSVAVVMVAAGMSSDLRGGDGIHLLVADWLRHLGEVLRSGCSVADC